MRRTTKQELKVEVVYNQVSPEEDAAIRRTAVRYLLDCLCRRDRREELLVPRNEGGNGEET